MWVALASIVMMFAALSSIYIFSRAGDSTPVRMPRMFLLSTGAIVISSFSFETAKRSLSQGRQGRSFRWLLLTLLLGLTFIVFQLLGWRELASQGVYLSGHPRSSFFYLFTGVHGVHVLGGIGALAFLLTRFRLNQAIIEDRTEITAQLVSFYWHTMDALWLWLFLLLLF
jgi:cytochrome c oxidase subunit 3